jgi:hypothetical protein
MGWGGLPGRKSMNATPFDLVIQNGRLIDPGAAIDEYFDVGFR